MQTPDLEGMRAWSDRMDPKGRLRTPYLGQLLVRFNARRLAEFWIGATGKNLLAVMVLSTALGFSGCAWQPLESEPRLESSSAEPVVSEDTLGVRAAAIALQQVGTPYRYGGQNPAAGFDCSGLVHYAYRQAGRSVPRMTGALWSRTRPVARHELRTGDLLFFSIDGKMQHVGLYVGEGRFAHAPSSGRTVTVESLSADFYRQAFLRGGRL